MISIFICYLPQLTAVKSPISTYKFLDLLETNIRQRGDVGGSAKKIGRRIKELERIYGIEHGGNRGNQYVEAKPNNSALATQEQLATQLGISVDTLQNYKLLADMIPELEELMDTGIVTKTTALAMMRNLSQEEIKDLIESNLRQRVLGNTNPVKLGRCFSFLNEYYGFTQGGDRKSNTKVLCLNQNTPHNQTELAESYGITQQTMNNYMRMASMISELEDLVDTGIVTKDTALAMVL